VRMPQRNPVGEKKGNSKFQKVKNCDPEVNPPVGEVPDEKRKNEGDHVPLSAAAKFGQTPKDQKKSIKRDINLEKRR